MMKGWYNPQPPAPSPSVERGRNPHPPAPSPRVTLRQKVGGGVWEGYYRGNGEKRRGKRVGRG